MNNYLRFLIHREILRDRLRSPQMIKSMMWKTDGTLKNVGWLTNSPDLKKLKIQRPKGLDRIYTEQEYLELENSIQRSPIIKSFQSNQMEYMQCIRNTTWLRNQTVSVLPPASVLDISMVIGERNCIINSYCKREVLDLQKSKQRNSILFYLLQSKTLQCHFKSSTNPS